MSNPNRTGITPGQHRGGILGTHTVVPVEGYVLARYGAGTRAVGEFS